ncbi:MAG TPA: hypothetical protein VKB88_20855 [Bryobacteraceae bacterium]|nr:hypothetical protein [Bryobacteraceae bacterium]
MKAYSLYLTIALFCLAAWGTAQARDLVVPAGTLMTCTLDEPKFSSATVTVGDPFLCYPRSMQSFGQVAFPRGTYLVGHLEADKDPGHFVGKGYLKLAFDRIGLPASDLPLNAKVIAVAGYNVDREGKIIGHGHATRDVVEWMLPPLWPWKIITLPARGPRPTLKAETRVTLRVMDDIIVPQNTTPGWHRFGEPSSYVRPGPKAAQPSAIAAVRYPAPSMAEAGSIHRAQQLESVHGDADLNLPCIAYAALGLNADSAAPAECPQAAPAESPLIQPFTVQTATAPQVTTQPVLVQPVAVAAVRPQVSRGPSMAKAWAPNVTLFVLSDGTVFPATQYWLDQDRLLYISDGDKGTVALSSIDWSITTKLNVARNVRLILRNAPVTPEPGSN